MNNLFHSGRKRPLAFCLAALCLAALFFPGRPAAAEKTVLITFAGDCTLGSEEETRPYQDSFDSVVGREGYGYPFARFAPLFQSDDWTVVNLEGVLSDSHAGETQNKRYRFRGPSAFAEILSLASVEAVCLANNHTGDYGSAGLKETQRILTEQNIGWFRSKNVSFLEKDGIRVAFMALDPSTRDDLTWVRQETRRLKASGEAQAVVVVWHYGTEYSARHDGSQESLGEKFVINGADLVIMHHSHVVQGVRVIGGSAVFYSLGNFVFGGNSAIRTELSGSREVTSLYSLVVQAELHFSDDGDYLGQQLVIYPALTSSDAPRNNYQPYPADRENAEKVMEAVQFDTDFPLPGLTEENGYCVVRMPFLPADSADENR